MMFPESKRIQPHLVRQLNLFQQIRHPLHRRHRHPRHRIGRYRRKTINPNLHAHSPCSKCSHTGSRRPDGIVTLIRTLRGPMRRTLRRAIVFLTLLPTGLLAQKRLITEKDLFDFNWIGDVQLSPSGKAVAFVQTSVTPDHSGYQTALYLLDLSTPAATPVLLTPGTHDTAPRFSPDGTQLAFLRAVEKEGKPTPAQLYLMPATPGASPIKLTDLPKGASSPQWAPNGQALTVLSATPQDQPKAKLDAAIKARATGDAAHVSDVKIINRAIWRSNGEGYLDPSFVSQLYLVYLPKPDGTQDAPWQLTEGRFGIEDYLWRKGTTWLLFSSSHTEEPIYEEFPHNSVSALNLGDLTTHPP